MSAGGAHAQSADLTLTREAIPAIVLKLRTMNSYFSALVPALSLSAAAAAADFPAWKQISSKNGDLPVPGESTQQTGAVIADFDKDGVSDFILSFREKGPALVWYRHKTNGWDRLVIDPAYLTVEAGGAVLDIDGDGDLDVVFGGDWQSKQVWWWENPYPNFDPKVPWKRHLIKDGGETQHHDQVFGDFLGIGKPQLAYWNQGAKKIFLAKIPENPRTAASWPAVEIFAGEAGEGGRTSLKYPEGMAAADIDGDGKTDLVAGNYWFKHMGGTRFEPVKVAEIGGRVAVGKFKPGRYPQIVIAPGDGVGPLRWYECTGNPFKSSDWLGHNLVDREVIHGHSLALADLNGDGNLDIFCAEMAKWTEKHPQPDNPKATAWIFYGNGKGEFTRRELVTGQGFHEAKIGDLNGDGRPDILNKPYNWETPRVDIWLNQGTSLAATRASPAGSLHGRVGLQLASLHHELGQNLPVTLLRTQRYGFTQVELNGTAAATAERFRSELEKAKLLCTAVVFPYERFQADLVGVAKDAHALGASFAVCDWIPHDEALTPMDCQLAATRFNSWGATLKNEGIRFVYHLHGYEFVPAGSQTLFDTLVEGTRAESVGFELDLFWVAQAGQDPVQLLKHYPRRFPLMRLHDLRPGAPTGVLTGRALEDDSVAIGSGQLDLPAILGEAQKAGVESYFLEDDSREAAAHIAPSLKFLETIRF